jgi:hypothetical protein
MDRRHDFKAGDISFGTSSAYRTTACVVVSDGTGNCGTNSENAWHIDDRTGEITQGE